MYGGVVAAIWIWAREIEVLSDGEACRPRVAGVASVVVTFPRSNEARRVKVETAAAAAADAA